MNRRPADATAGSGDLPLAVLTGFLGAGKSTRLARLLRRPEMANAAVIVNEFGDVGIDHHLVDRSDDRTVLLANGCLCCQLRDELTETLLRLLARRQAGELAFDRVVVETSGLADPGPLLATLAPEGDLAGHFRRGSVCAMVNAASGLETLRTMAGAARQVALADHIYLTKTDLGPPPAELPGLLRQLNAEAVIHSGGGDPSSDELFAPSRQPGYRLLAEWTQGAAGHAAGISAAAIVEHAPLPASLVPLFLQGLSAHAGERILRVKGIVQLREAPETPMLIQGVGRGEVERTWLDRWPSADRGTRISVIGFGIPPRWPAVLLSGLWAELRWLEARTRC